jgi:hypothetical protein
MKYEYFCLIISKYTANNYLIDFIRDNIVLRMIIMIIIAQKKQVKKKFS